MTIGSLFSGVGGLELGLEWAGMGPVKWQVENDDYATRVLEKHWPDVRRYRDIRDCGKHNLEPVDLVCGGFPCQPFSVAGKRRGAEDDRHLWPEMLRVIDELRPAWVVGENVPGFIKMGLDEAVSGLESLGYACRALCIPAVAVDAPHLRQRVFIVAYAGQLQGRDIGADKAGANAQGQRTTDNGQTVGSGCESEIVADTESHNANNSTTDNKQKRQENCENGQRLRHEFSGNGQDVPHTIGQHDDGSGYGTGPSRREFWKTSAISGNALSDTEKQGFEGPITEGYSRAERQPVQSGLRKRDRYRWLPEPDVGRVADGVPHRVDKLRCLGNAVVPQVAQAVGEIILQFEREKSGAKTCEN